MHEQANREDRRLNVKTRRAVPKASITCEVLEGRQLLSGGFGGGGMGGIGFIRADRGGSAPADLAAPASDSIARSSIDQANQDASRSSLMSPDIQGNLSPGWNPGRVIANGNVGSDSLRPYRGWNIMQSNDLKIYVESTPEIDSAETFSSATLTRNLSDSIANLGGTSSDTADSEVKHGMNVPGQRGFVGGFMAVSRRRINPDSSGTMEPGQGHFDHLNVRGNIGAERNEAADHFLVNTSENSEIQIAIDALKAELEDALPSDAKPSYASLGLLMDDSEAIRDGTLAGDEATSKVKADEAAVLTSLGVSNEDLASIQSAEEAVVAAINAASGNSENSDYGGTETSISSIISHDPLRDIAAVPLLPFLNQLRQNQLFGFKN